MPVLVPLRLTGIDVRHLPTLARAAFTRDTPGAGLVSVGNTEFVLVQGPLGSVRRIVAEALRQDAAGEISPDAWRELGRELAGGWAPPGR